MNTIGKISLLTLLSIAGCSQVRLAPSEQELRTAAYGSAPAQEEVAGMVRKYLKVQGYFDPNGAEIESCTAPNKKWAANPNRDSNLEFLFGWAVTCDVNGKNRMGGFIGFQSIEYLIRENKVVAGLLPQSETSASPLFTPESKFLLWGD